MKNKLTITVETYRRTTIRKNGQMRCELCADNTTMLAPEEAAEIFDTTARTIYRLIEKGVFHFTEARTGELLICGNSIQRGLKSPL